MTIQLSGPFDVLTDCHLWIASYSTAHDAGEEYHSEDLAISLFGQQDLTRWRRFRPVEKKLQFLVSRMVVGMVLEKEFGPIGSTFTLDSDSRGRPKIVTATGEEFCRISLAHSGTVIAVVVSRSAFSVGVDVEVDQPLHIDALRKVAVSQAEMRWLGCLGEKSAALVVWVVKEAVWKSLGGPEEVTAAEIVVECQANGFISYILHPSFASVGIQLATFSSRGFLLPSSAGLTTEVSLPAGISLLGCVAQYVPH